MIWNWFCARSAIALAAVSSGSITTLMLASRKYPRSLAIRSAPAAIEGALPTRTVTSCARAVTGASASIIDVTTRPVERIVFRDMLLQAQFAVGGGGKRACHQRPRPHAVMSGWYCRHQAEFRFD